MGIKRAEILPVLFVAEPQSQAYSLVYKEELYTYVLKRQ